MRIRQVWSWLNANGKTLAQHCRDLGVDYEAAKALLKGTGVGLYGKSHEAAVALGLKSVDKRANGKHATAKRVS
ncbi:DNA-binding protein [bacterium]|nr:DNA-binding protein [bacterium]